MPPKLKVECSLFLPERILAFKFLRKYEIVIT